MVNNNETELNLIFSALSDPTRRAMLLSLAQEEQAIAELSAPFDMSKSAITKHVKVLENAGLLRRTIDGRVHHCRLQTEPLQVASEWMDFYQKFWNEKFDAMDAYLAKQKDQKETI